MNRSKTVQPDTFKEAPLIDHLEELRFRIIWALVAWIVGGIVVWNFLGPAIEILKHPLTQYVPNADKIKLVTLRVTEGLTTGFVIAAFGGLILAMPVMLYQIWAFIAPGLTRRERGYAIPFIFGSIFSFATGIAFAYFVALPFALPFLVGILPGTEGTYSISDYVMDIVTPLAFFGLLFQLPLIMYLIGRIGLVGSSFLAANRRIAIFAIVVVAAIVTPTQDPVNLAVASVPLWLLFEFGIWLVRLAERQNAALAAKGLLDEDD